MKTKTKLAIQNFPKRIEHFKNTKNDWYPNFPNNQVKLIYHSCINSYKPESEWVYRVSVWGNDDFGIMKDFRTHEEAKKVFNELDTLSYINHSDLYDRGFERF
jgi:hypothetical protein